LISVVLNAPHWYTDSGALLDYGFAKLAAQPADASAEVLSVASRGAANFVLASATSTPKIEAPSLKQGGGIASTSSTAGGSASAQPPAERGAGLNAPVSAASDTAAHFTSAVASTSTPAHLPAGSLTWLFLGAGVLVLLPTAWFFTRRRGLIAAPAGAVPASVPLVVDAGPAVRVQPAKRAPAPRTLGEAPITRRREPNLMLSREDLLDEHIHRGINLSAEARQGSAMAEFLMAIRGGAVLDAASLDREYGLSLTAYLALSRAQAACGLTSDAVETLRYAVGVLPQERILRLALRQLER
jgi:hypothetical protein